MVVPGATVPVFGKYEKFLIVIDLLDWALAGPPKAPSVATTSEATASIPNFLLIMTFLSRSACRGANIPQSLGSASSGAEVQPPTHQHTLAGRRRRRTRDASVRTVGRTTGRHHLVNR